MNSISIKTEAPADSMKQGSHVINYQAPCFQSPTLKFENLCTAFVERSKNLQNSSSFPGPPSSYNQFIGKFSLAQFCMPLEEPNPNTNLSLPPCQALQSPTLPLSSSKPLLLGNTVKNRARRKSNKGLDYCLLPKIGTAKPRQTKPRTMTGVKKSGKLGKKDFYAGARVKETVREKLERMRSQNKLAKQDKIQKSLKRKNPYVTTPSRSKNFLPEESVSTSNFSAASTYRIAKTQSNCDETIVTNSKEAIKNIFLTIQAFDAQRLSSKELFSELEKIGKIDNIILDKDQSTFLHYMSSNGDNRNITRNESIMTAICSQFASGLNCQNSKGETPLHVAVSKQNIGAINALLRNSADISVTDHVYHETVLHRAVRFNNPRILNTLVIYSPSNKTNHSVLDIQDIFGRTALHIACEMLTESGIECSVTKQMVSLLMDRSYASQHIKNREGVSPYMILSSLDRSMLLAVDEMQMRPCFSEEESPTYNMHGDMSTLYSMPSFTTPSYSVFQAPVQRTVNFDYSGLEPSTSAMNSCTISPSNYGSSPGVSSLSPNRQFFPFSPNTDSSHSHGSFNQSTSPYESDFQAYRSPSGSPHYHNIVNQTTGSETVFNYNLHPSASPINVQPLYQPQFNSPTTSQKLTSSTNVPFVPHPPQFNIPTTVSQYSSNNNNNVPVTTVPLLTVSQFLDSNCPTTNEDFSQYLPSTMTLDDSTYTNMEELDVLTDILDESCMS